MFHTWQIGTCYLRVQQRWQWLSLAQTTHWNKSIGLFMIAWKRCCWAVLHQAGFAVSRINNRQFSNEPIKFWPMELFALCFLPILQHGPVAPNAMADRRQSQFNCPVVQAGAMQEVHAQPRRWGHGKRRRHKRKMCGHKAIERKQCKDKHFMRTQGTFAASSNIQKHVSYFWVFSGVLSFFSFWPGTVGNSISLCFETKARQLSESLTHCVEFFSNLKDSMIP